QKGIMDGRKCSGRPRTLTPDVLQRFVEMVKASCEHDNDDFIFVSKKMRSISNYHNFLEQEFMKKDITWCTETFFQTGSSQAVLLV
ncbi:MAG: hypothetical protein U9N77_04525, partial [Thermodesulfobacteriota bacterium]|nr:hypothetical protein [Thermodesulfobacteriota bacterium]